MGCRAERVRSGEDACRAGGPARVGRGGKQPYRELTVAGCRRQGGVDTARLETVPDGLPQVGAAQALPGEVRQDAGPQVVVGPVGEHHHRVALDVLEQRLADGEGGLGCPDPHQLAVVGDVLLGPAVRPGHEADDSGGVPAPLGLLDHGERRGDGRRRRRRGARVAHGHPRTCHDTSTATSWLGEERADVGEQLLVAVPGSPYAVTRARAVPRHGRRRVRWGRVGVGPRGSAALRARDQARSGATRRRHRRRA